MLKSFYLNNRFYYVGFASAAMFICSYFIAVLFVVAVAIVACLLIALLLDAVVLYSNKNGIYASRILDDRFSLGDDNKIIIELKNSYSFPIMCTVLEELPYQFQTVQEHRNISINSGEQKDISYSLRPVKRGEYHFGNINVYVTGLLHLAERRYTFSKEKTIKVYPSVMQLKRYELMATASVQDAGMKRMRKLGHSLEFEHIKEYVRGDDYRTINWLATARRGDFMVNNYTDERSQQIYCVINKGRSMKMPFDGLSLLDYAINTTLVLSKVALLKQDRAGLITFGENMDSFIAADKKQVQINAILETLYKQQTDFLEPDYEKLFSVIRNRITQRSLLVLFVNFESFESFQRVLPSLKHMAHYHLLLVVFFENTEVQKLSEGNAATLEEVYIKTIADKYSYEKKFIVKELQKNGIISILSTPQKLTVNTINKYLELKQRQSI